MSDHSTARRGWMCAIFLTLGAAGAPADELADPMRPTPTPPPVTTPAPSTAQPAQAPRFNPDQYRLQAVYQMGSIQRARINGTWYETGDRLADGVTISRIDPDNVQVRAQGNSHTLQLDQARARFQRLNDQEGENTGSSSSGQPQEAR
ncbi:MAG: general secretion pathway protein GspB [Natronospirillum sp.]|uniref:hypothetical protein n=1 Tax=Natronospirillum sp. TaxID=2812955 RepID=UPI0025EBC628|nr:hypothetical protein [Natronospirillum sp.]MCH8550796.1 general secretion pathway protein GspB [Natronospirillum sp.]